MNAPACQDKLDPYALLLSLLALSIVGWPAVSGIAAEVSPVPRAHAHNDYHHDRPLLDALDQGFCSVEADIFLVDGQLLVGHGRDELREDRTLQSLYLDPLRQRARAHGGRIYPDGPGFTLLIDVKSAAEPTYRRLHDVLADYRDLLTRVEQGRLQPGAVTVIISGNRARDVIAATQPRYAGIDGRLSDLMSEDPAHLMPLISDNWSQHFSWNGQGPMPAAERQRLQQIVQQAHAQGRRVRFWATPEDPVLWHQLRAAGVDLINTDQLARLRQFLMTERTGPARP